MNIHSYLTFSGNCREAMIFYQDCLGGELVFQTVGESPLSDTMPAKMKNCILHSMLTKNSLVLMGTDIVDENGYKKGNTVSLMLDCDSEEEIETSYKKLSAGGTQTQPVALSFWGALFGGLTDKFGNHWLLHYQKTKQ